MLATCPSRAADSRAAMFRLSADVASTSSFALTAGYQTKRGRIMWKAEAARTAEALDALGLAHVDIRVPPLCEQCDAPTTHEHLYSTCRT